MSTGEDVAPNPIDPKKGIFTGTTVPWIRPFEYAGAGRSLDEFFADHPEVDQEQVIAFLESTHGLVEEERREASTYRQLAKQGKVPSWKESAERVLCCLVGHECRHEIGPDAALISIADQLQVHFYLLLDLSGDAAEDGSSELVITASHLSRWRIKLKTLADTAGWNSGEVAVWAWPRVAEGVPLNAYPDHDTGWIAHLVSPGCLLEHADVPYRPIVMVADARTAFLTGTGSIEGQELMLRRTLEACGDRRPLTRRPLVIDDRWTAWHELPDDENPLSREYARHFGAT